jgi:hypothetical protein
MNYQSVDIPTIGGAVTGNCRMKFSPIETSYVSELFPLDTLPPIASLWVKLACKVI